MRFWCVWVPLLLFFGLKDQPDFGENAAHAGNLDTWDLVGSISDNF